MPFLLVHPFHGFPFPISLVLVSHQSIRIMASVVMKADLYEQMVRDCAESEKVSLSHRVSVGPHSTLGR